MKSLLLTYLLWLIGGLVGVHKFYLGRPIVGLLYCFTGGIFVVGWVVDFFTLPRQVHVANLLSQNQTEGFSAELRQEFASLQRGLSDLFESTESTLGAPQPAFQTALSKLFKPRVSDDDLMLALLRAAQTHSGHLSVTEGVLETGMPFAAVERVLQAMVNAGYVYRDNDPSTGVVVYVFKELF